MNIIAIFVVLNVVRNVVNVVVDSVERMFSRGSTPLQETDLKVITPAYASASILESFQW